MASQSPLLTRSTLSLVSQSYEWFVCLDNFCCLALLKRLAFDQGYILVIRTPSLPPHRRDGFTAPAPSPRLSVFPSLPSPAPLLQPFCWRASPQQPPDAKTAAVKGNSALSWPTVRHAAHMKGLWRREHVKHCDARRWPG